MGGRSMGNVRTYPHVRFIDFCCVAACVEAVLQARGITVNSQLDIALELGLTVPSDRIHEYPGARVDDRAEMWGEHIHEDTFTISDYFERHKIPLRYQFCSPNEVAFKEYWMWADNQLAKKRDILVFYDYSVLQKGSTLKWGHCSIVVAVDDVAREIFILSDPGNNWEESKIKSCDMIRAIYAVNGGFGVIGMGFWSIYDL